MRLNDRETLLAFMKEASFKHDPEHGFTLSSGKKSDFYIDCKPTMLSAYPLTMAGALMLSEILKGVALGLFPVPDMVAGVAVGGIPLASSISTFSVIAGQAINSIIVRKDVKAHGTARKIETPYYKGEGDVIIVEDVITTGTSTIETAMTLRDAGYSVKGVVALVDRLEGGTRALNDAGLHAMSLFTRDDFIPPR